MIEIVNFKLLNKGAKIAAFDAKMLKWGGYVIKECNYFESGSKKWITLTSKEYESEGKKKYFEIAGYEDREMNAKLKESIMKEFQKIKEQMK